VWNGRNRLPTMHPGCARAVVVANAIAKNSKGRDHFTRLRHGTTSPAHFNMQGDVLFSRVPGLWLEYWATNYLVWIMML
jgi:hypothetical protein